jgi:uncharacterized protein YprB with RNaseH-like and TPR domain
MSSLADRLREVVRPRPVVPDVRPASGADAADTLGGEWRDEGPHRYLVVDRRYTPGHVHGHRRVCDMAPDADGWPRWRLLAGGEAPAAADTGRFLFLDLETTGLAGGAGTYAFLVGCAWFEPPAPMASANHAGCFRVRQFFLASFGAESRLLDAVAELATTATCVVTFNGKTFDLPLIENRFLLHRKATPFAGLPHVDMLHPARRLWRSDDGDPEGESSCKLTMLERTLCGHERDGDVPGFEIPARYFGYVRSGDARPLEAVLEHNRLDLLSLAFVTARASQLLHEGPAAARTAREALGMARLYERGGLMRDAAASYWRAVELPGDVVAHAEGLRGYAVLARRERRFSDAADAWRRLLGLRRCPPPFVREATEALAVHHEHRVRDLQQAREFALQSLHAQASVARRQAVEHRLARLNRKLGLDQTAALF